MKLEFNSNFSFLSNESHFVIPIYLGLFKEKASLGVEHKIKTPPKGIWFKIAFHPQWYFFLE